MNGKEANLKEQIIEEYKDDLVRLLKYLPFLEKKGGKDVQDYYEGDGENKVIPVPVYDSTLLGFVKEARSTKFMYRHGIGNTKGYRPVSRDNKQVCARRSDKSEALDRGG